MTKCFSPDIIRKKHFFQALRTGKTFQGIHTLPAPGVKITAEDNRPDMTTDLRADRIQLAPVNIHTKTEINSMDVNHHQLTAIRQRVHGN